MPISLEVFLQIIQKVLSRHLCRRDSKIHGTESHRTCEFRRPFGIPRIEEEALLIASISTGNGKGKGEGGLLLSVTILNSRGM